MWRGVAMSEQCVVRMRESIVDNLATLLLYRVTFQTLVKFFQKTNQRLFSLLLETFMITCEAPVACLIPESGVVM